VAAGSDVQLTTHADLSVSALKRFLLTVGERVSMFAQQGIRLLSARGRVEIQAQRDALALSALKDVSITSTDGRLVLSAAKEVWIGAGGSYIRISGECIENGTPGDIYEKCAWWGKQPLQLQSQASNAAQSAVFNERFSAHLSDGTALRQCRYQLSRADGAVIHGHTDPHGTLSLQQAMQVEGVTIRLPLPGTQKDPA
jgi:type VI secretion system secreted protein VgrG